MISRELVKETVREDTNEYKKMANISFSKDGGIFSYDNLVSDPHVDPLSYCLEAQRLFELYQTCVGRRQIETVLQNYVESMQAVKAARGHLYFVPRDYMAKLNLFEDFVKLLEDNNQFQRSGRVPLDANSMFVVDDAKQREKMASAFYDIHEVGHPPSDFGVDGGRVGNHVLQAHRGGADPDLFPVHIVQAVGQLHSTVNICV